MNTAAVDRFLPALSEVIGKRVAGAGFAPSLQSPAARG